MSASNPAADPTFECARWTRFGHDRLYITAATGEKVGFRDLKSGMDHPDAESDREIVAALADAWLAERGMSLGRADPSSSASAPTEQDVPDTPEGLLTDRPWVDLSLNRPGEAIREVALNKRAEAPVRTTLARLLGVHTDERAWRIGADGEQLVAGQLAKVSSKNPAWTSIHSIPVGANGSDIDHLVLGPGGVFTVNAKHHPGADIWVGGETLMVRGSKTKYIRNARFEAERAGRLLSAVVGEPVTVHGLVVAVNAKSFTVKRPPKPGVTVLYRNQLADWLLRLGPVLDQDKLNRIWAAARRSTTWHRE
ncbi:NERD domain-containing protein [Nocardioides bigeumensis]|uniref:NERD domain-containing protein n=1 Tax=Nocardioides bigeumensis TaxID=433657 RepID=A0ABN2YB97_9ACTN